MWMNIKKVKEEVGACMSGEMKCGLVFKSIYTHKYVLVLYYVKLRKCR